MNNSIISAKGLSKGYILYASKARRFFSALLGRNGASHVNVLGPLDLEVKKGEAWGLIGDNGAGKTTLLKLVAGVIKPSEGELKVRGRVSSILELGMGFHPELTGRENVSLNAVLQGFTPKTMKDKIREIEEFADIGSYFDLPVKYYSSGMHARVGFSLAVNVDPDILVVDEALAVGDGRFVAKCLDKMTEKRDQGTTILFVSHSIYMVTTFCRNAVWLKNGKVEAMGDSKTISSLYEEYLGRGADIQKSHQAPFRNAGGKAARIIDVRLKGIEEEVYFKQSFSAEIHFELLEEIPVYLAFSLDRKDGAYCYAESTKREGLSPIAGKGRHKVVLNFDNFPLFDGEYKLVFFVMDKTGLGALDKMETPFFKVKSQEKKWGVCHIPHRWEIK